jgi:sulfur-carrier protein
MQVSCADFITVLSTDQKHVSVMRISIKLYAGLDEYLPGDTADNSFLLDIGEQTTVHGVIDRFNIPREKAHLILLNGVFVEPGERYTPGLFRDGDTLAIWPPVAGG